MSRNTKNAVLYVVMPVLYSVMGLALLLVSTKPLLKLADAKLNMLITNGKPGNMAEYEPSLSDESSLNSDLEQGEIQEPVYGTQYGEIVCEKLQLKAPVFYGDDEEILEKGAGQYIESAMPGTEGTILIAGHDSTYFEPLEQSKAGDVITIQTSYGSFTYEIEKTKISSRDDSTAYELKNTGEELILYTCYPFGKLSSDREERFYVYCKRIEGQG